MVAARRTVPLVGGLGRYASGDTLWCRVVVLDRPAVVASTRRSSVPGAGEARSLSRVTHVVEAGDRRLAVDVSGAGHGMPVFLLHGTPGSRHGPKPRGKVLYTLGIRLIAYDRPGYGGSSPRHGRTVADAAADVEAIADSLGIDRFAVLGRSGGGPHALACAALLPDRVTRTAALVSVARPDADLNWFDGMNRSNIHDFAAAAADPLGLVQSITARADRTKRDPESLVVALESEMHAADHRVVKDVAMRRLLADTYREALREGPHGWIDDVLALRRDWGFQLESIVGPVLLWHGREDNFAPASHSEWLASRIYRAEIMVQAGAAHFGAVEIVPEMLRWLVGDAAR
jgi:pimeloyl-ACP methyl ester carboxylesterase